ncbi:MAG TPA: hypothetical protein VF840_08880, partial [Terriglobales bacterium]
AKRELFSDSDEVLLNVQRPVILNGIEEIAVRGDLVDRAMIIELTKIPDGRRKTEKQLGCAFEQHRPGMLGYLLDGVSGALARVDHVTLPNPPRMADFAEWITAAEESLAWEPGVFMVAYRANRREASDLTIDASPVGRHIVSLPAWDGTSAELLARLASLATESERKSKSWPQTPRALSHAVRCLLPSLRAAGIEVACDRKNHGNRERRIHFSRVSES